MNGDGEANIIFGDGLEDYTRPVKGRNYKFPQEGFDLIVANPPYSIQSFKTHLGLKNSDFTLFDHLTETASEIEVLFIERTAQLLREGGIAGVVLPSSILSNTGIYTRARELMLQRFAVKAIVEFGSNTFMATGTNTVTLFLTRRNDRIAQDFHDVADDFILKNTPRPDDFTDTEALLATYAQRLGLDTADYQSLLTQTPTDALKQTDLWRDYVRWFDDLTEIKNFRTKNKVFTQLDADEQQVELNRLFYERVLPREQDKFWYFCLTYGQPTLIVRLPTDGADEKKFLGYEFSRRRGDEGIKKYTDAQGRHQTSLYDEETLHNPDKLNTLIWQVLSNQTPTIPDALRSVANVVDLSDCLDFTRVDFEKQVGLSAKNTQTVALESKWPQEQFGNIALLEYGTPLKESNRVTGEFPVVGSNGIVGTHETYTIGGPAIVVGRKGSAGKINWIAQNCTPIDTTFYVKANLNKVSLRFLYLSMLGLGLDQLGQGAGVPGLNRNDVYRLKIPLPPVDVQQQIVNAIEAIEQQEIADNQLIQDSRIEIEQLVNVFFNTAGKAQERISELFLINEETTNPAKVYGDDTFIYVDIERVEKETGHVHFDQIISGNDAPSRARRVAKPKSVLVSTVRPNLKGFAYLDEVPENCIFSTGFAILCSKDEARCRGKLLYYYFMYANGLMAQMEEKMPKAAYPSINDSDISGFRITILPGEQDQLLDSLQTLEARIEEATARLGSVAEQKADVLERHLQ